MFDTKINSVKKLWSNLNTVCSASRKNAKRTIVNAMNVNGSKLEDRNDICSAFNDYFATLSDKLVEKLPSSGTNTFKNYLSSSIKNSISPTLQINMKLVVSFGSSKKISPQAQIILDLSW